MKLIRDRVPEIMRASGQRCAHRIATPTEYRAWLNAKLIEEAAEVIGATVPGPVATLTPVAPVVVALVVSCRRRVIRRTSR